MRWPLLLGVGLLISGCGKNRQDTLTWPAFVSGKDGFSEMQVWSLEGAIESINLMASQTVVSLSPLPGCYPIHFQLDQTPISLRKLSRAGHALASDTACHIKISSFLFEESNSDLMLPVLLHELGHCKGLNHSKESSNIMFPVTSSFSQYSPQSIERHLGRLTLRNLSQ